MTTSTRNPTGDPVIVLDADEADDLAHLLRLVEDWLRHADDEATQDLTRFVNGPGNGRLAAAGLIQALGGHAAALACRCREVAA
jgi:hypothetical protein